MTSTYLIGNKNKGIFKIGYTSDLKTRLVGIQVGCPYKVEVIFSYSTEYAHKVEKVLHRKFALSKTDQDGEELHGEWFGLDVLQVESFLGECKKVDESIKMLKENSSLDIDKFF